jgi:hypothetical protein
MCIEAKQFVDSSKKNMCFQAKKFVFLGNSIMHQIDIKGIFCGPYCI